MYGGYTEYDNDKMDYLENLFTNASTLFYRKGLVMKNNQ